MKNIQHEGSGSQGSLVYGLDDLQRAVDFVYPLFAKSAVITLTGSLGAGKTTLVQALLTRAGVTGPIQSPTFTYVNTYDLVDGSQIHHFDVYRLHSLAEFLESGFDEYLYQKNGKALIEWPAIIDPLLQHDVCHIELDYEGLDLRKLTYRYVK